MTAVLSHTHTPAAASQRQLYEAHCRRIYSACLRIIGNAPDAEEAMHDAFLKIFANLHKAGHGDGFYAWSQSIAIRTAIDRIRKKKIAFEPVENLSLPDNEPDDATDDTLLTVEHIRECLGRLPDGYRIILSLRLFEEYDFAAIADALHIKESTVRSQFARGRQKLIHLLQNKTPAIKKQISV
jgi:RNA polymerase sigma-70 factor (ECF subfamily)